MADTIEQNGILNPEDVALLKPDFSDLEQKLTKAFAQAGYNGNSAELTARFFSQTTTIKAANI